MHTQNSFQAMIAHSPQFGFCAEKAIGDDGTKASKSAFIAGSPDHQLCSRDAFTLLRTKCDVHTFVANEYTVELNETSNSPSGAKD